MSLHSLRLLPAREGEAGGGRVRWQLVSVGLLRVSGVAAERLDAFLSPELDVAWDAYRAAQRRADELQTATRRALYGPVFEALLEAEPGGSRALVALRRAQRRVARRREVGAGDRAGWERFAGTLVDEWNAVLRACAAASDALGDTYEREVARHLERVGDTFAEPRLQEALYVSNPEYARRFLRPGGAQRHRAEPNAGARRDLLTAHRFLRRLCARCETTSFFGPVLHATLDERAGAALTVGEARTERAAVDGSVWLVRGLARHAAKAVPVMDRCVRRDPLWREAHGGLEHTVDGQRRALPSEALRVWRELRDGGTLGEAFAASGVPPGAARAVLGALSGLVRPAYDPPSTTLHALQGLVDRVDPDRCALPGRFLDLARRFAGEAWPGRRAAFDEAEALAAEHGIDAGASGGHFSDRGVFHEERSSPYDQRVVVGGAALEPLQAGLDGILALCLLGALLAREDAREALRRHLAGSGAPLAAVAAADLPSVTWRRERLAGRLAEVVQRHGGEVVELAGPELLAALEDLWGDTGSDRVVQCLPSLDVLWDGREFGRDGRWVLGEVHDDCSSIYGGCTTRLHDTPHRLFEDFCEVVAAAVPPASMATVVSRRRSKHITPELPGVSIELSGRAARPQRVPIAEVEVPPSGDGVLVHGQHRQLYPGDLRSVVHRALALPCLVPVAVRTGSRTPRVVVDGLVYQRATWYLDLPGGRSGRDGWEALQRLREQHGLPRAVFVRHPAEPKPMYVDFGDPLALRDVDRLPAATVQVTESLPDRRDAWWPDAAGPQVAELRLGCLLELERT